MDAPDLATVFIWVEIAKEVATKDHNLVITKEVGCLAMLVSPECKSVHPKELDIS